MGLGRRGMGKLPSAILQIHEQKGLETGASPSPERRARLRHGPSQEAPDKWQIGTPKTHLVDAAGDERLTPQRRRAHVGARRK